MLAKIIRGIFIGTVLGVIGGIGISNAIVMSGVMDRRAESLESVEAISIAGGNGEQIECGDVEDTILRFHVRANSNSDEDIALKYAVRDTILYKLGCNLDSSRSKQEVIDYLEQNKELIKAVASQAVKAAGFDYEVNVYMSNDYFPIRQYGELVLPAGNYEALRVDIGAAEGENFWCILYPMMCYTDDSCAVLSKEDSEKLKTCINEEAYEKLFVEMDTEETQVQVRFSVLEWLGWY